MEIINKPVEALSARQTNARSHPKTQIEQLVASIKAFGFTLPLLVDEDDILIAGHGRLQAAKKLGLDTVPVVVARGWTDEQKRAYCIADNKLALNSTWDRYALENELLSLKDAFDISLLGFTPMELSSLIQDEKNPASQYTAKADGLIYEPTGECPKVSELYDTTRRDALILEIKQNENLSKAERAFLIAAAARHVRFNYSKVAEFYAHAPAETQALMENSALVIIDLQAAVEKGFAVLTSKMEQIYGESYPED